MKPSGLALTTGALLLALLALLWWSSRRPTTPQTAAPTMTPLAAPEATTTPTATPSPARHRLAGVAAGPVGYVVVEAPDGSSALYRLGDEVPGLGRVTRIRGKQASFDTPAGPLDLRVAPAPSPSPSARRPTPIPTRTRRPVTATWSAAPQTRTARESSP